MWSVRSFGKFFAGLVGLDFRNSNHGVVRWARFLLLVRKVITVITAGVDGGKATRQTSTHTVINLMRVRFRAESWYRGWVGLFEM